MIYYLKGILTEKKPTNVIVDIQGIGYEVNIPLSTYEKLPSLNKTCFLWIYHHIREDNQSLYGFSDRDERDFFKMLISVSGIGPKLAINMMSGASVEDFRTRIISGDIKALTSLPGIGPKTAKRLIVELKEKFVDVRDQDFVFADIHPASSGEDHDAYLALLSLGYRRSEALKAIGKVKKKYPEISGVDKILKMSLKEM